MKHIFGNVILFLFYLTVTACSSKLRIVSSPDGNLSLNFSINEKDRMTYVVKVKDSLFVSSSLMGFIEKNGVPLSDALEIVDVDHSSSDET